MKQSAGIILLDIREMTEARVLCLRAFNNWDFPKGRLDAGETHIQAAIRELQEETGYNLSDIEFVQTLFDLPETVTYGSGKRAKTATYFYAVLSNLEKDPILPVSPELGKPEHDEWRWVSVSKLSELLPARLLPIANKIQNYFMSVSSTTV